jgi:hypothetical protein
MESASIGDLATLPDGQLVKIEKVYDDGYAIVRRVKGEFRGQIAHCAIAKLGSTEPSDDSNTLGVAPSRTSS